MKKFILAVGVFLILIISSCQEEQAIITNEIETAAVKVASSIRYYDNMPNYYVGENEIEGQCGDYAVLFALETGANIIVQQNGSVGVKNGIYRLKRIPQGLEEAVQNQLKSALGVNYRSGFFGPYTWDRVNYNRLICHPQIGIFYLELIREYTVITHFGINMQQNGAHVWNELNGIIIDACWADVHNMPFFGIDN